MADGKRPLTNYSKPATLVSIKADWVIPSPTKGALPRSNRPSTPARRPNDITCDREGGAKEPLGGGVNPRPDGPAPATTTGLSKEVLPTAIGVLPPPAACPAAGPKGVLLGATGGWGNPAVAWCGKKAA